MRFWLPPFDWAWLAGRPQNDRLGEHIHNTDSRSEPTDVFGGLHCKYLPRTIC
jgi:hypothetical protein